MECSYTPCKKIRTGKSKFCSKNCNRKFNVHKWRIKNKIKCVEYKGGCCSICGYNKCLSSLDFHHLDKTKKEFAISANGNCRAWEKFKTELDKCIILCKNCHSEIHSQEYDNVKKEKRERIGDELEVEKPKVKKKYQNCIICKKENISNKLYCSVECSGKSRRKVERPSLEQLNKDLEEMSIVKIGKKYGVSDNAIRKWLKAYTNN